MDKFDLYNDIATRTKGDVYIGVVGPVRTGKSTFIKRFMETLVLPQISDTNEQKRATDEMPQSAGGRIVMTTQPKFVPSEAIRLKVGDGIGAKVRLVDCVGYMVDGAEGDKEDGKPRMVRTPWQEEEIPFDKAAEIGTEKVIRDHSTIGVIVTQDGSVTDIPRASYVRAEERVVNEMKSIGKPFVMILNTTSPTAADTLKLRDALSERYGVGVLAKNLMTMGEEDFREVLSELLLEFPIKTVDFVIPDWMRALGENSGILVDLLAKIGEGIEGVEKMRDVPTLSALTEGSESFTGCELLSADASCGKVTMRVLPAEGLFYKVLSEETGRPIEGEYGMMTYVRYLAEAGAAYEKLKGALRDATEKGYGIVAPSLDEMVLEEPEIFKQSGKCGVKLKASAPSLHIMRVDVNTEVSPIVGSEQQGEEMVKYLLSEFETDKKGIWETNLFGKSLSSLVREEIQSKLSGIPEDAQNKVRRTLGKMVNEGRGGMICILL